MEGHHVPCSVASQRRIHVVAGFVNGAVHWVVYDEGVASGHLNLIVSFNMGAEAFSEMMLPPFLASELRSHFSITSYEESLDVVCGGCIGVDSCSIWVMKEYRVAESWTKLFSIDITGMWDNVLGFRKNGEVLISTTDNWLVSYNPRTKTMAYIGFDESSHIRFVDTFMEILVFVKEQNGVLKG